MEENILKWLFNPTIGKFTVIFFGIAIVWSINKFIKLRILRQIKDNDNKYRARKMVNFIGIIVVIILATVVFSNKLGGLTVAFGVAGAGIAFSLQEVIASIAGWLAIMFAGFYKTGDRVQLGGIKGDVIDVNVLRTTIMETGQWVDGDLYNGRIVRVANSFVFKEPVYNYSGDFPFLWDEIKIPIRYGSDYKLAREMFLSITTEVVNEYNTLAKQTWPQLVNKYMIEDAETSPMVTLVINDNWVEFTIRYVVDYKKRRSTKNEIFSKILTSVEETNGVIKFASATFEITSVPDFNIKSNK
jgi:small-conductance mechanosensitive channel